ncbi:hypothetical protein [Brachyspira sp. G79]|uniref:hypothetical protein n=1 Tax=Brachyspira sp. G79 TaxID=1358104 RepID=UPI000BBC1026|nr:hypothetical protein [Brachyspira sp. G79]PCG20535.1 hypothetical protein KQ44_11415 [Brachyspira sp. G79]
MSKLIHIKKLGLAFNKDDFVRVHSLVNPKLDIYGIYIYFRDGKSDFIKCTSKRQANLWCTLIVKKIKESENDNC